MNHEENDDLWKLLGKAKQTHGSPFFSRNVLREIRERRQEQPGVLAWLRMRWQLATLGAAALLVAGAGLFHHAAERHQISLIAQEVSASPDYYVISHLDELMDSAEDSVWLDNSVY